MVATRSCSGRDARILADEINETSRNGDYLPGVDLPKTLTATSNLQAALVNATQVYIAIPSQSLRETLGEWKELIPENATVISLMKGLEQSTGARMSEVIHQATDVPASQIAVLSGPNLALEIARRDPAAAVCACEDQDRAVEVARVCSNKYFTVFTNQDLVGIELGGVLKNLIAVAIGIVSGLGYGQKHKGVNYDQGSKRNNKLCD